VTAIRIVHSPAARTLSATRTSRIIRRRIGAAAAGRSRVVLTQKYRVTADVVRELWAGHSGLDEASDLDGAVPAERNSRPSTSPSTPVALHHLDLQAPAAGVDYSACPLEATQPPGSVLRGAIRGVSRSVAVNALPAQTDVPADVQGTGVPS
jgi:hypothetical protein